MPALSHTTPIVLLFATHSTIIPVGAPENILIPYTFTLVEKSSQMFQCGCQTNPPIMPQKLI